MKDVFNNKLIPGLIKFSNFKFVKAMQAAVTAGMGATILGSIFMVLNNPPFPADMTNGFIEAWRMWAAANGAWLNLGYQVTLEMVGLYTLIGMAVAVSEMNGVRPTNMIVTSTAAFLILTTELVDKNLAVGFLNARGMVTGMLVGYFVVEASCYLLNHGLKIKLPDSVPPFVAEPISSLLVNIVVIGAVVLVRLAVGGATGGQLLPQVINNLFAPLFMVSDSFLAAVIYAVVLRFLWFFGLHGGNIAGAVMTPIVSVALAENASAFAAGQPMPHIFTQMFVQTWVNMGVLPMVAAMMLVCRSQQNKAISKIALVPALFNIGEPLTFGLPVVMNFKILVPWLLCFGLNSGAAYLATSAGFIGRTFVNVPYTVPCFLKVFLSTMDYKAVILYVILFAVNVILFIPWLKRYDQELVEHEKSEA